MTPKLFSELGLSAEILKAIDKLGFEQTAPIQAASIPVLMAGRDVVGQSQTGSGKTAAFAIPAIEKTDAAKRVVQVLILCPTRELAVQVSEEVHKLALFKRGISALPIYGGQSYERQFYGLKQGAQIVIGTPGRLMDHMERGTLRLDSVKMVVLDEADVMLDMGFREDIEFILEAVPATRQTVFFSATMPRPIQELIQKFARDPQSVRIEQKALTVPTVDQVYYEVDRRFKIELLTRLIDIHDFKLGIIFCNTKRMVDDLVDHLEAQGYSADRLHGDMSQVMRDRVMNKFRKSGLEFLVATDVAARGIDVDDVQVVFNYDLPYDPEDYVHRIGRTGRAGRSGQAISFASGREVFQIRHIERFTNTRIHRSKVPTLGEVEEARANVFLDKLRTVLVSGEFKRQDHLIERLLEEGFVSTDIASALIHLLQGGEVAAPPPPPREKRAMAGGAPVAAPAVAPKPVETVKTPSPAKVEAPVVPRSEVPMGKPVAPESPAVAPPPDVAPAEAGVSAQSAGPAVESSAVAEPSRAEEPAAPKPPPAKKESKPRVAAPENRPATPPYKRPQRFEPDFRPGAERRFGERPDARPGRPPYGGERPPFGRQERGPREWEQRPGRNERDPRFERGDRPPWDRRGPGAARPFGGPPKASRATPGNQTRLWMSIGSEMGVGPGDIVGAILGETGLPSGVVGVVDIRERHLFVDVAEEHANGIIAKLNRTRIKGHKVKTKLA